MKKKQDEREAFMEFADALIACREAKLKSDALALEIIKARREALAKAWPKSMYNTVSNDDIDRLRDEFLVAEGEYHNLIMPLCGARKAATKACGKFFVEMFDS